MLQLPPGPFTCPQHSLYPPPPCCSHGSSLCTPPYRWPSRGGSCTSQPCSGIKGRSRSKSQECVCGRGGRGRRGKGKKCPQQPACPGTFLQQLGLPPDLTRWLSGAFPGLWPPCSRRSSCQSVGAATPRDAFPPTLCLTWGYPVPLGACASCRHTVAGCRRLPALPKCTRSGKIYGWG